MRWLLAAFVAAHGIAHLVGFAVTWQLTVSKDVPYTTTVLNGRVDLGDGGIRVVGLLWLALAIAFAGVAAALALRAAGAWSALAWAIAASTCLCLVSLPAARIGLVINALLVLLYLL